MSATQQEKDFVAIINRNQLIINNLCKIYYKNVEDQRDARQDIVLQLWKAFPSFRGESKLSTWIYSVSLNTILAKIRKQKRRIQEAYDEPLSTIPANAIIGVDDDVQLLKMIIETLEEEDKAVVILYLEGYKNKEIASMLRMTATNVSTRLHRVKIKLRIQYQKMNYAAE